MSMPRGSLVGSLPYEAIGGFTESTSTLRKTSTPMVLKDVVGISAKFPSRIANENWSGVPPASRFVIRFTSKLKLLPGVNCS